MEQHVSKHRAVMLFSALLGLACLGGAAYYASHKGIIRHGNDKSTDKVDLSHHNMIEDHSIVVNENHPGPIKDRVSPIQSETDSEARYWLRGKATDEGTAVAMQQFTNALICRDYLHAKGAADSLLGTSTPLADGVPSSMLSSRLESLESATNILKEGEFQCVGIDRESLDKRVYELSMELGLKGYLPAQACFVEGPFLDLDSYYRKHESAQQTYLNVAPRFMVGLLAVGDWAATLQAQNLMGSDFGHDDTPQWLEAIGMPNPYLVYRSLRIVYYRVKTDQASSVNELLSDLEERFHFSPTQISEADSMARKVYAERYAGAPPLDIGVPVSACRRNPTTATSMP